MEMDSATGSASGSSLETRPGILLIGSPNVGKRTLLSRLLSIEIPDTHDLSAGVLCQGWSIETKYYSADVAVWVANLGEDFSLSSLPNAENLAALVMVFDMTEESSLHALENWAARTDIKKFEILLCIGNKVDLMPGHQAHTTYKRCMQRRNESSSDPHPEYSNFGINEEEGSSLLGNELEDSSTEIRNASLDWCTENNIEYIEACASNADFDKCLSVDGNMQGVERVFSAICAHMWPGMILKSGNRIPAPILLEKEVNAVESSDEECEYEIEYETLSHGSDDTWNNVSKTGPAGTEEEGIELSDVDNAFGAFTCHTEANSKESTENRNGSASSSTEVEASATSTSEMHHDDDGEEYGLGDMERLMSEIGNVRDNLRLMPDFQRREMAAKLAMRMAAIFGGISDDEETDT